MSRIGLRNGINTGLACLVCPGISQFTEEGERLRVDIITGEVQNLTRGTTIQAQAWPQDSPPFQILMAGGFNKYFRQQLIEAGKIKS
jgi:3-isopropylmalate/(R)-2-methylmalate dehydratase small subunit